MSDFTCVGCGKPVEFGVALIKDGKLETDTSGTKHMASCKKCFGILAGTAK